MPLAVWVGLRDDDSWLLRKHGYPPDLQDAAVHVLQQAEALSAEWAA
jgi:hypothetical protein